MNKIINLMKALNYPVESKGVCAGIIQMWEQACLVSPQEEQRFLERIEKINSDYQKKIITKENVGDKLQSSE